MTLFAVLLATVLAAVEPVCPGPNARGDWIYPCVTTSVLNLTGLHFERIGHFEYNMSWNESDNEWEEISGGAIRADGWWEMYVTDSCFIGCYTMGGGGGAIYSDTLDKPEPCTGTVTLTRVVGVDCYAGKFGGFLCCDPPVVIDQLLVEMCRANKTGASIEWYNEAEITDLNVTKCVSKHFVINCWQADAEIWYSFFTQNKDDYCVLGVQEVWEDEKNDPGVTWGNISCKETFFYNNDAPAAFVLLTLGFDAYLQGRITFEDCYFEGTPLFGEELWMEAGGQAGRITFKSCIIDLPKQSNNKGLTFDNDCDWESTKKVWKVDEEEVVGCKYFARAEGGLSTGAKAGIGIAVVVVVVVIVIVIIVVCRRKEGQPRPDTPMVEES